jgi:hypothetical protein
MIMKVLRFEAHLWRALFRLVTRRRDGSGPGVTTVSYHRATTPVWMLMLFASAVEIPVLHLVVPWRPAQLALIVLGVWGVFLFAGLWAAYVTEPYLVNGAGIRLRHGPFRDLWLDWAQVADVTARTTRDWPGAGMGASPARADGRLGYVVNGATTVVLTLVEPVDGRSEVHIGADDPAALLTALRTWRPGVTAPPAPRP